MAEQRKLIRLGNSSFAISLPKEWIDKSGLKKGDKIFVEANSNGELIVAPEFKTGEEKEVTINLEGKEEREIARDLISVYIAGSKIIGVIGSKDKIKIAKEKSKNFLDLELIEDDGKKATFKDLLNIENIEIEKFIRRMDNNIKEMFDILFNITNDKKRLKERLRELGEIDKDITKFYFLIWRFMNLGVNNPSVQANLKIEPKSFINFFWIAYNLEQIGDELKRIARKLDKVDKGKNHFLDVLKIMYNNYNSSIKAFFDKNKNISKEVILKKEEIVKMCDRLSEINGFEGIAEKLHQINASIHNNSKMVFYGV